MPPIGTDRLWDIALSPALWLSVALALAYGTLFTLWRGGGWRQWLRDLLTAGVGFSLGQLAGILLANTLLRVGDVHVLWATLGAVAALLWARRRPGS